MKTSLCLNMIVRNESRIIKRCLECVASYINYWIIVDTGSTDNTKELIQDFFKKKKIKGEIHEKPFENFGFNRTYALQLAQKSKCSFTHILFTDADMCLRVKDTKFHEKLNADVYSIQQHNGNLRYYNTRIVSKMLLDVSFVGFTHEYCCVPNFATKRRLEMVWFMDHGDGGSKNVKFIRDEKLLKMELKSNPYNPRALFYLGNSLRDQGKYKEAIDYYLRHQKLQAWNEENYISQMNVGHCYLDLDEYAKALYCYITAWEYRPSRAEALYSAVKLCRQKNMHRTGWELACKGIEIPMSKDVLFVSKPEHTYKFLFEQSILAFYVGKKKEGLNICNKLLTHIRKLGLTKDEVNTTRGNLRFYLTSLQETFSELKSVQHIKLKKPKGCGKDWALMNPSITKTTNGSIQINLRLVNYFCDKNQRYFLLADHDKKISNKNPIMTKNYLTTMSVDGYLDEQNMVKVDHSFIWKSMPKFDKNVVGIEDVRIFNYNDKLYGIATSPECDKYTNKMVLIRFTKEGKVDLAYKLQLPLELQAHPKRCEKNWMPFCNKDGKLLCFYNMYVILEINIKDGVCTLFKKFSYEENMSNLRGSAAPITIRDNWYCVVHEVLVDNTGRRTYCHRILRLSPNLDIQEMSKPFMLMKNRNIEYVIGLAKLDGKVMLTWGEWDAMSFLTTISIDEFVQVF